MMEQAPWLLQPTKGNRSKRLFGLPAPLVKDEKTAQFGLKSQKTSRTDHRMRDLPRTSLKSTPTQMQNS